MMKQVFIIVIIAGLLFPRPVESQAHVFDTTRNIEVIGSSELEVKPDIIELSVTLQEYYQKGSKNLVGLTQSERDFYKLMSDFGIKKEQIILDDNLLWISRIYEGKKDPAELKQKNINLRLDTTIDLGKLVAAFDKEYIAGVSVTELKNSHEQDYRRLVKIAAIKAAKEKAAYLLEAIGEHLGKVVSVREIEKGYNVHPPLSAYSNSIAESASPQMSAIPNARNITYRYEMEVKFEIQ